jgi:hypothetical protein
LLAIVVAGLACSSLTPEHNWLEMSKLSSEERAELLRALNELSHIAESQPLISLPAMQGLRITQLIAESRDGEDDFGIA